MHGFIWDNDGVALEEWKNGYTYEGDYMSNRAITYTTKYMLKVHKQDTDPDIVFTGGQLLSAAKAEYETR